MTGLAFAAVGTAAPTPPATGAVFDWSSDTDYTEIVSESALYLDEGDITFEFAGPEGIDVRPPGVAQRWGVVWTQIPGVLRAVDINLYELGAKVLALTSNMTNSTVTWSLTDTITPFACVIEFQKLAWLYMPRVEVYNTGLTGGRTSLGKAMVRLEVLADETIVGGVQTIHFADAI